MEETGEAAGAIPFGERMDPAAQERLTLAVDEDVRPPQGMLEEFERFSATWGGKRPTNEVVEGLLAWGTVRMEHQGGVHA